MVPNPVIVVEIAPPSTCKRDASLKLTGYFRLERGHQYLIIDPKSPSLIYHRRHPDGTILTFIVHEDGLNLIPPGIELVIEEVLQEA